MSRLNTRPFRLLGLALVAITVAGAMSVLVDVYLPTVAGKYLSALGLQSPTAVVGPKLPKAWSDGLPFGNSPEEDMRRAEALSPRVHQLCGACHAYPEPALFPKERWAVEVNLGYDFYEGSSDALVREIEAPPQADTTGYYIAKAPKEIEMPRLPTRDINPIFVPTTLKYPDEGPSDGCVSDVAWYPPQDSSVGFLTICDMRHGRVIRVDRTSAWSEGRVLANIYNPARLRPIDSGEKVPRAFLLAELGVFLPSDDVPGRLYRLDLSETGRPARSTLLKTKNRVADAVGGDLDGDGDLEFAVAEFGWRSGGALALLDRSEGDKEWQRTILDERPGASDVRIDDIDGDGRLDIVALFSQQHEVVEAYIADGLGGFERRTIFDAKDPAFGSSGMDLVDFDVDGDLDILFTNGDMLDFGFLSPNHAVRWFENRGEFPFRPHIIGHLPGAYRAVSGDIDLDGDLDVVASAYISNDIAEGQVSAATQFNLLVWFEHQRDGSFLCRPILRTRRFGSVDAALGDFDSDGDLDIAAGLTFFEDDGPRHRLQQGMLTIWSNGTKNP
ncbi:FG-GAP repeat domain-containing protein [Stratiformator vulcanicus]|uniref:FG-GAP repeat protein n=1 Tax=Stratiformator vulcanicus TaxID=2527980 RepID=A0A517R6P9_9PLAN|nr:VCBS repeat-containing protein [Stratiformator vulcanicus]QDT39513.1 FG-GAP repeat protein [Stratiformator vulcanicus]